MRGQTVAGHDERTYQVDKRTGKLHFLHGGMPVDEARVHPEDVAEFQALPKDFEVTTEEITRAAPPPPPKKAAPPPRGKGSSAAKSAGSSDQLGAGASPPASKPSTKRADEKALPSEAAGWSSHRLLTEASMRGIKLTTAERGMNAHELHALIASKVGIAEMGEAEEEEKDDGGEE